MDYKFNANLLESCLNGIEDAEKRFPKSMYDGALEEEFAIEGEISGLLEMAATYLYNMKKISDKMNEDELEEINTLSSSLWNRYSKLYKKYSCLLPEKLTWE